MTRKATRSKAADRVTQRAVSKAWWPKQPAPAHASHGGAYYVGDSVKLLNSKPFQQLTGKVQLLLTSPPFPLNKKKSYGNKHGEEYLKWFEGLGALFSNLISDDGSIVIEVGNSWEPKRPVQSLLALEALLAMTKAPNADLRLVQQFICYNPSRLPSPATWVTVNRIRTVDSFTHVWWLAKSDYPKADNSRVLRPYSSAMRSLLKAGTYNGGKRPSEHNISTAGFLQDRGGAIAHNVFELEPLQAGRAVRLPNAFSFANNSSNNFFHKECKRQQIGLHPARMPLGLATFFIDFLSDAGDVVLDPFGGSNTTGYAAALAGRRWISIDACDAYVDQSIVRFQSPELNEPQRRTA